MSRHSITAERAYLENTLAAGAREDSGGWWLGLEKTLAAGGVCVTRPRWSGKIIMFKKKKNLAPGPAERIKLNALLLQVTLEAALITA